TFPYVNDSVGIAAAGIAAIVLSIISIFGCIVSFLVNKYKLETHKCSYLIRLQIIVCLVILYELILGLCTKSTGLDTT
ncbi:MAG: hypothetical protein K2M43_03695, partial [Mycoplasmoidaceae bacterium]|nr:hypothetical protein [Mycoplasmoidaceae bacterium]